MLRKMWVMHSLGGKGEPGSLHWDAPLMLSIGSVNGCHLESKPETDYLPECRQKLSRFLQPLDIH